jgi:hypothetical protein
MLTNTELWPWMSLALLGAFHGLNPAMGWLFAVALGLQERRMKTVVVALAPIGLGHALAIACIAVPFGLLQIVVPSELLLTVGGLALIAYAAYKVATRFRHPRWVGMRINPRELVAWSALMAAAHGAGLMLIPALSRLSEGPPAAMASAGHAHHSHHAHMSETGSSLASSLAAVTLHTAAMLAVMGVLAVIVYRWVGVDILRKAWVNLDLIWTGALFAAGAVTLTIGFASLV